MLLGLFLSNFIESSSFAASTPMTKPITSKALPPGASKKTQKSVLILMLHHFTTDPKQVNYTTIDMARLEQQIIAYKKAGYEFVKLGDAAKVQKPIILSIDDGYYSVYELFYPLAKKHNIPFNLNVIMSRIGDGCDNEILKCTVDQLVEMKNSGLCQLGVHSYDAHGFRQREGLIKEFEEDWTAYQTAIFTDTQKAIELYIHLFGEKPTIYAYPYGKFSDYTERMLKELGFTYTLTTMYGKNAPDATYTLKRINLN